MKKITDIQEAIKTNGSKRSNKWPAVRKAHLANNPTCAACGGKKKVEVHHIQEFSRHPELELDPSNLISLCEGNKDINCHLVIGHLFSFRSFNVNVVEDAKRLLESTKARPAPLPKKQAA